MFDEPNIKYLTLFHSQLAQPPISDHERRMQSTIKDKMRGINLPQQKCKGALLMELAHEIKELKEELEESKFDFIYLLDINLI